MTGGLAARRRRVRAAGSVPHSTLEMPERPDLYTALVVLTAGRSSRMGEPKALLRFGRRTALELAVHNAIEAGVRHVVAVVGHRAEEIRAAHSFTGLPVIFDWAVNLREHSPMLLSLQAALEVLEPLDIDAFFFQPIDVPLVLPSDLVLLMTAFDQRLPHEKIFVPSFGERGGHPVLCDAALIPDFLDLAADRTPRDLMREVGVTRVETENPGVIDDMDTRDDYRRLRDVYAAREGSDERTGLDRFTGRIDDGRLET